MQPHQGEGWYPPSPFKIRILGTQMCHLDPFPGRVVSTPQAGRQAGRVVQDDLQAMLERLASLRLTVFLPELRL